MSKELEAFNDLKEGYTLTYTGLAVSFTKDFFDEKMNIIESALKDYQLYKEILDDYGFTLANFREACLVLAQFRGIGFTGMENKLQALEIIKNKVVDMDLLFHSDTLQDYNEQVPQYVFGSEMDIDRCLTKEEYGLLKEVLCNGR